MSSPNRVLWQSIGASMSAFFSSVPGQETREFESGWMVSTGEPIVDLNCAAVYGRESASQVLNEINLRFSAMRAPYMVSLADEVAPELESAAKGLGLHRVGSVQLMSLKPGLPELGEIPRELSITQVGSDGDLLAAASLATDVFNLPEDSMRSVFGHGLLERSDIAIYLAKWNGEPASMTLLTLDGPRAGVWCMGTVFGLRRRGIARSLLLYAMSEHLAASRSFYLIPTPSGKPLYEAIGFRLVAAGQSWTNVVPLTNGSG